MIAVCKMPVSFLHGEWHNIAQFFQSSMRNNKKKLHPPPRRKRLRYRGLMIFVNTAQAAIALSVTTKQNLGIDGVNDQGA